MKKNKSCPDENKKSRLAFLTDVLICSLGAYGGPEAHFGVFGDQLVSKKKYLTEEELAELIALTGILPGPSSTQTIIAIGYKTGGPLLALLTFLVWALPAIFVMMALSFLYTLIGAGGIKSDVLRYIGPMAVGFMASASLRIGRKTATTPLAVIILLSSALITYFYHAAWIYPAVLILGGFCTYLLSREDKKFNSVNINPPWRYLIVFALIAAVSALIAALTQSRLLHLFESFYRYGYLVIGGGQVVIPLMFSDLTEIHSYMSTREFLTGFGLVQGLPGPMFSFCAYAGGMAARGVNTAYQLAGALISGVAVFLPGILLIYFVYPVWQQVKKINAIRLSIKGITSSAAGLIAASTMVLLVKNGFSPDTLAVSGATCALLFSKKIPAPLIVAAAMIIGVLV